MLDVSRDPLEQPEQLIRVVYAYIAYRIGGGYEAEDLTSEVFERALRYRESFDSRKGTPTAWLIGIARRCIDGRRVSGSISLEDVSEIPALIDLEGTAVDKLSVRDAVSRLGERDRELIALRYGADLSARQIAKLLSMRTNAVEVALHRTIERLREALDGS